VKTTPSDPNTLAVTCDCVDYTGARCDVPCPMRDGTACGGNGTCVEATGASPTYMGFLPPANASSSSWSPLMLVPVVPGDAMCTCDPSLYGVDCNTTCGGSSVATACSAHGSCTRDGCVCDRSYVGPQCGIGCPSGCGDGAICVLNATDAPVCECEAGLHPVTDSLGEPVVPTRCVSTAVCDTVDELMMPTICSGRGNCSVVMEDGVTRTECLCEPGFSGESCGSVAVSACPIVLGDVCAGHGTCEETIGSDGNVTSQCNCNAAYGGEVRHGMSNVLFNNVLYDGAGFGVVRCDGLLWRVAASRLETCEFHELFLCSCARFNLPDRVVRTQWLRASR